MSSALIIRLAGEPSGKLRGKPAIREYWRRALAAAPQLRFELLNVFAGVDSVVIHYRGHRGPSAEFLQFGVEGKSARHPLTTWSSEDVVRRRCRSVGL